MENLWAVQRITSNNGGHSIPPCVCPCAIRHHSSMSYNLNS
uniref:Uncharacterized protein n=1 Tax=Arundo donax TaxID=35708 RepID=A0A0A9AB23_ARUDO